MEKIKPIELVSRLNGMIEPNASFGSQQICRNNYILSEDLWALEKGIYTPLGKLVLPVTAEFDDIFDEGSYKITLWSSFACGDLDSTEDIDRKYNGKDDGKLRKDIVYYPNLKGIETLVTRGELNETPFDLVMKRHIPEFLKLYDQTKGRPATIESLQNIRKAFVDYRS